jgi:nanoRNase/pAp phosphatase (c-di-AMP/oligoRNAs hydrolase)
MTKPMQNPFPKSVSSAEKSLKLQEVITPEDTLGILIDADPDAMASALALKRFFWRRVKKVKIAHINKIERADNLAFIRLLNVKQQHIRRLKSAEITKWALVDSQPGHHGEFSKFDYDIIIDHHPVTNGLSATFIDIRENYGANSTILTEYLRASKIKPSPRIATALFYGIKTDTDNFVRNSIKNDINAFRYLYKFANLNLIKKIESSEITQQTIAHFKAAMDDLTLYKHTAFIHMDRVANADILVMVADFFLKMAEATWSFVSGIFDRKLVIVIRNAGFRRHAGTFARKMFGDIGSAGGHRNVARVEIPLENISSQPKSSNDLKSFVLNRVKKARENLL